MSYDEKIFGKDATFTCLNPFGTGQCLTTFDAKEV